MHLRYLFFVCTQVQKTSTLQGLCRSAFLTILGANLIPEQKTRRTINSNMQFQKLLHYSGKKQIDKATLRLGLRVNPEALPPHEDLPLQRISAEWQ